LFRARLTSRALFVAQKRPEANEKKKLHQTVTASCYNRLERKKTMASNEELLKDDVLTDDSAIKDREVLDGEEIDEDDEDEEEGDEAPDA
jgi:hypothetical protein